MKNIINQIQTRKDYIATLLEIGVDDSSFFSHNINNSVNAATILALGGHIVINDYQAEEEDEQYGKLAKRWVCAPSHMEYFLSLDDLKKGLKKCYEDENLRHSVERLLNDDPAFDICDAENIMQVVVFGEIIYG